MEMPKSVEGVFRRLKRCDCKHNGQQSTNCQQPKSCSLHKKPPLRDTSILTILMVRQMESSKSSRCFLRFGQIIFHVRIYLRLQGFSKVFLQIDPSVFSNYWFIQHTKNAGQGIDKLTNDCAGPDRKQDKSDQGRFLFR